jgi:hypothetical protein
LVLATEVVESAVPPPASDADNLAEGRVAPKADVI